MKIHHVYCSSLMRVFSYGSNRKSRLSQGVLLFPRARKTFMRIMKNGRSIQRMPLFFNAFVYAKIDPTSVLHDWWFTLHLLRLREHETSPT
jgi:hypothetical protein